MHWPSANLWVHEDDSFAPFSPRTLRVRSRIQRWIEKNACGVLFIAFPILWVMVEICVLAGVTDEGLNLKSHIYGDGYYQSPLWRFSSSAELRTRFVPNGSGNMTSRTVFSNYSMLRDRPSSEILKCLADDYLMPFNALRQPSATGSFSEFWSMIDVFMARPDWLWAFTHWLVSRRANSNFRAYARQLDAPKLYNPHYDCQSQFWDYLFVLTLCGSVHSALRRKNQHSLRDWSRQVSSLTLFPPVLGCSLPWEFANLVSLFVCIRYICDLCVSLSHH